MTIEAAKLTLFLTDYDGPFLEGHVPDEQPADSDGSLAGGDGQPDLGELWLPHPAVGSSSASRAG